MAPCTDIRVGCICIAAMCFLVEQVMKYSMHALHSQVALALAAVLWWVNSQASV
jgi:hypothetical protein